MNVPGGGYIDTSWSSIRTLAIFIMGVTWFYLLNQELRSRGDEE